MTLRVSTTIQHVGLRVLLKNLLVVYGVMVFIMMIRVALARVIKYYEPNGSALFLFELFD